MGNCNTGEDKGMTPGFQENQFGLLVNTCTPPIVVKMSCLKDWDLDTMNKAGYFGLQVTTVSGPNMKQTLIFSYWRSRLMSRGSGNYHMTESDF